MKIIRATHLGMCFGVRDAIALAKAAAEKEPITILGELVHNQAVLDDLRREGVEIETRLDRVKTPRALVTAHGTSRKTLARAQLHGLQVAQATCPLVHHAHRSVEHFVQDGFYPVIIGKADHVEVRGITDDLAEYTVVESEMDLARIPPREKIGVAAQTTQPIARVRSFVQLIREKFPRSEVRFADTVCLPTKQRQYAAEELARHCEVVIVIGGANSNNTRELAATCEKHCRRVYHVQSAAELRLEWFQEIAVVGVTAGTSTPDWVIDAVEQEIQRMDAHLHREFPLPLSLAIN